MTNKINILGTDYEIIVDRSEDNPKMRNNDAYVELFSKKIVISQFGYDDRTVEQLEEFANQVVRHEIVHAFFHESGLEFYGKDETLVEWIALQLPKMFEAAKKAEAVVLQQGGIEAKEIATKSISPETWGTPNTFNITTRKEKASEINVREISVWRFCNPDECYISDKTNRNKIYWCGSLDDAKAILEDNRFLLPRFFIAWMSERDMEEDEVSEERFWKA